MAAAYRRRTLASGVRGACSPEKFELKALTDACWWHLGLIFKDYNSKNFGNFMWHF